MGKKKKIKVLLAGVGDLRNYGCEGIVQGTYAMFQKHWSEAELIVAVRNPKEAASIFADKENISFVKDVNRFSPYRIAKGLLKRIKIGNGSPLRLIVTLPKNKDIFLSGGGDNFCEAPDGSIYLLLKDLMKMGEYAIRHKIYYVLWGVSIGPFSSVNESNIFHHLKKVSQFFVREKIAYDYVKKALHSNYYLNVIADPAFCMLPVDYPLLKKENEIFIGLNISRLAFNEDVFPFFNSILTLDKGIKIICVPHVMTDEGGPQDDFSFLQKFIKQIPNQYKERVILMPADLGAQKTKGVIAQCDLLIASRMHACVAGISTATPTLFLTYSNKGKGMAHYAYGDNSYTLSNENLKEENLIMKIQEMLDKRTDIKQYLLEQKKRFVQDAEKAVLLLKENYQKSKQ